MDCFLCRKHNGLETAPPDGYIYEDEHWMVCHEPGKLGPLSTLFIELKRHFLDYSEMTDEERIYQVTLMEGVLHYHSWLVPRRKDDAERGMKFLARDDLCSEEDAALLANKLREAMK